uniref:TPX2 C-terminal domain-containing protein n=1 Tax=Arundo donax TaxID=35708 RepID=A0A0A8ZY10_ARUDO
MTRTARERCIVTEETALLFLYSAKRKGKGRAFRSENEEDAARGERLHNLFAQGLPFSTDEPEVDKEIEIKQLRKELVPRAHPMPDFTRPFVPKR